MLDFANEDTVMIDASDFGGGLAAATVTNAQYDVRLNNVAQTATVRFVWESDIERLWFDRNGSTSGGHFLVADLQNGAVVTREDILFV